MVIRFGLELDDRVYPEWTTNPEEIHINCGVHGLLSLLEQHLGLSYRNKNAYLRIEQYRQVLQLHLKRKSDVFYKASYTVDSLATAEALLERRDTLVLANWDFQQKENMPERLKILAQLEALLIDNQELELDAGFAERYRKVEVKLAEQKVIITKIYLNEPLTILPPYLVRLFNQLSHLGVQIKESLDTRINTNSNLAQLQRALLKKPFQKLTKADKSLGIIKARREVDLARYIAQLLRLNKAYRPICIVQNKNRSIDTALVQEGFPSMGLVVRSSARPNVQILRLIASFLWKPLDPYKVLEFLSLPQRPLQDKLAERLGHVIAKYPGIFSSAWRKTVREFFDHFNQYIEKSKNDHQKKIREAERAKIQEEYQFWFNRRRYDAGGTVPRKDVIEIFDYVQVWGIQKIDEASSALDRLEKRLRDYQKTPVAYKKELAAAYWKKEELLNTQQAFQALFDQSYRLIQVLEALPRQERNLTRLQLNRLVKTIQEPTSLYLQKAGAGHLAYVYAPSAMTEATRDVLWWNFTAPAPNKNFPYWYPKEATYLEEIGLELETTQNEANRRLWQRMQPILKAENSLIVAIPELVEGRKVPPHPLLGDIQAICKKGSGVMDDFTLDIDEQRSVAIYRENYALPIYKNLEIRQFQTKQAHLHIKNKALIKKRERESFSSLNQLFYYPYKWFFQCIAELNESAILSVVEEKTMLGNLAHTIFEALFRKIQGNEALWTKEQIQAWVEKEMPSLFEREGAVLLMYGKEPERIHFVNQVQKATWALVRAIQDNHWKIKAVEHKLTGNFLNQAIVGVLDLVLERERAGIQELALVDLKWGGLAHRKTLIKNQEDLQLVLYSKLLVAMEGKNQVERPWASTAFFIIDKSKLVARTTDSFKEAEAVAIQTSVREINQAIFKKMQATYIWRLEQLAEGKIEIRTEQTFQELEEELNQSPLEQVIEMLEMKLENAFFDPYKTLINPLR